MMNSSLRGFIISRSAKETKAVGRKLGKFLQQGDTVLLMANLGSGKTTLVQGLIRSFGIKEEALSPTFIIAQTLNGKVPVHHLDFYRLSPKEIWDIGVEDYLHGKGEIPPGVTLIEWADRCKNIWPRERLEVRMKILPRSNYRKIEIKGRGRRYRDMAGKILK